MLDQTASSNSCCACGVSTADCASGLQTQGVSASGVRGYPANLLLHDRQAQRQASAPQSAHHYHHDLPDSFKYQPQVTELSSPQVDDMHSLPDAAGNSMGGGVMQKVSPQAISQTANFSRFNHSALSSSRKLSAPMHTHTCKPHLCLVESYGGHTNHFVPKFLQALLCIQHMMPPGAPVHEPGSC